jgi:hypothetical protein
LLDVQKAAIHKVIAEAWQWTEGQNDSYHPCSAGLVADVMQSPAASSIAAADAAYVYPRPFNKLC